jgi:hypothetical protein
MAGTDAGADGGEAVEVAGVAQPLIAITSTASPAIQTLPADDEARLIIEGMFSH